MAARNEIVKVGILRALDELGSEAGASKIAVKLGEMGIVLQPRTIRFYLLKLDHEGLTQFVSRRRGRVLTDLGREEIAHANIFEKVGFVATKVDLLGYRMSFDIHKGEGSIVSNIGMVPEKKLSQVLKEMKPVFTKRISMGDRVVVAHESESLGGFVVPDGYAGIATVCSVTVNGVMLKHGIPVSSRFGGLLEIRDGVPLRFVELIEYHGTTIDPLEILINAGMTRVRDCAQTGSGIIGASFREVPTVAMENIKRIKRLMDFVGLGGIIMMGKPNMPLLDIPVSEGRTGIIVAGGLNPIAAVHEAGIGISIRSLAGLEDYSKFVPFSDIVRL